jgi:hypothetical protein
MSSSLLSGSAPSSSSRGGRGRRLGDRLAQVLRLEPEALLDGAEVLRLHRRVAVRDGVEDGLEPVLQLARGRVGGHGLDGLLDVEDDVVEVAARAGLDVHLAEVELLERVARRRDGAVGARGGQHLLVGLGDVAPPSRPRSLPSPGGRTRGPAR